MRTLKLGLLAAAFTSGFGWFAAIIWILLGFAGWCLRPAERGWRQGLQVVSWSVFAWWTVILIIIVER